MAEIDIAKKYPLSTNMTFFLKYIFTGFWITFAVISISISWLYPEKVSIEPGIWDSWSKESQMSYITVIFSLAIPYLLYYSAKLKEVFVTDEGIILSNGFSEKTYNYSEISYVGQGYNKNYIIIFKNKKKIYFIPPILEGSLYKDPFYKKLQSKIKKQP